MAHYSDYANRLQRSSSYVRDGSVIDLASHARRSADAGDGLKPAPLLGQRGGRDRKSVENELRRLFKRD